MNPDWSYSNSYSDYGDYPPAESSNKFRGDEDDYYYQEERRQRRQYYRDEPDDYYNDDNDFDRRRSPSPRYYGGRYDRDYSSPKYDRYSRSRSPDYERKRDRKRFRSPNDYDRGDDENSRRDEVDNRRRERRLEPERYNKGSNRDDEDKYRHDDERRFRRNRNTDNRDQGEEPNRVIVLRNLAYTVDEQQISAAIKDHFDQQHVLRDVRLIRSKDTGESRGFAFAEFIELKNAIKWMDDCRRTIRIRGQNSYLEYSKPRDWTCSKCGHFNFKMRKVCMVCKATRPELESRSNETMLDGGDDISNKPTNVLLIRGVDVITREESVLQALKFFQTVRIDGIKIMKDDLTNTSRGFCFVRMPSMKDASFVVDAVSKLSEPFKIDNKEVVISYGRGDAFESAAKKNLAAAAIAAAQWSMVAQPVASTNNSTKEQPASNTTDSNVEGVKKQQEASANQQYVYDEKSGYYYYFATGLYYDPNSQYFYNSSTGQYLYWNAETKSYVPVATNTGEAKEPDSKTGGTEIDKDKQSKIKITLTAKKVMKDMERWAKSSTVSKVAQPEEAAAKNPKGFVPIGAKSNTQSGNQNVQAVFATIASKAKEEALESKTDVIRSDILFDLNEIADEEDVGNFVKDTPETLIDFTRFACLLCRRQFPGKDALMKHIELSDLHKSNLAIYKSKPENEAMFYRDRAKERRQLYGQPDKVAEALNKKSKFQSSMKVEQPTKHGLKEDNVGNKMLKAMGWSEGEGLGRAKQGIVAPISAQVRSATAGLGADCSDYGVAPGDSYQDTLKKLSRKRYNQMG